MNVEPIKSASIILLREDEEGLEVLTMTRPAKARFAPGATVFPGGKVDEEDRLVAKSIGGDLGWDETAARLAAIRELEEETGITLAGENAHAELVKIGHWITPDAMPIRFDTFFYLARAPEGQVASDMSDEADSVDWLTAEAALREGSGRSLMLPTRMHFLLLARFTKTSQVFDYAERTTVVTVTPVPKEIDGQIWLMIPEEAGYGVSEVAKDEVVEFLPISS